MSKVVEKILEILQGQAELTSDLLDIMFSDRPTSYRKARRSFLYGPPQFKTDWAYWYRQRQIFYSQLNKLKREGLIRKKKAGVNSIWNITRLGRGKLKKLQERGVGTLELPQKLYPKVKTAGFCIVSYDIPERERKKRDWLRATLLSLGLLKLQNSVWAGKVQIPEELIKDLRCQGLLDYVHIFSVDKEGTITRSLSSN